MSHQAARIYRRRTEKSLPATPPDGPPLHYSARGRPFVAPADADSATLARLAAAVLDMEPDEIRHATQGPLDVTFRHRGETVAIAPRDPNAPPPAPPAAPAAPAVSDPHERAARFRLARQAQKAHPQDEEFAVSLARARAALIPGPLTYVATLHPGNASARITAPAYATRRQVMQASKTALRCNGFPFRPLEYLDPPRITATAKGITLTIRPATDAE